MIQRSKPALPGAPRHCVSPTTPPALKHPASHRGAGGGRAAPDTVLPWSTLLLPADSPVRTQPPTEDADPRATSTNCCFLLSLYKYCNFLRPQPTPTYLHDSHHNPWWGQGGQYSRKLAFGQCISYRASYLTTPNSSTKVLRKPRSLDSSQTCYKKEHISYSNCTPISYQNHNHFGKLYQNGSYLSTLLHYSLPVVPLTPTLPSALQRPWRNRDPSSKPLSHNSTIGWLPSTLYQGRLEVTVSRGEKENTILHGQVARQVWRLKVHNVLPVLQRVLLGWLGREGLSPHTHLGKAVNRDPARAALLHSLVLISISIYTLPCHWEAHIEQGWMYRCLQPKGTGLAGWIGAKTGFNVWYLWR